MPGIEAHPAFEGFFIAAILLNTVVIALNAQYRSFDLGEWIKYLAIFHSS